MSRRALVLGGSTRLGGAVARTLAGAGCAVTATWRSRRPDLAAELVQVDLADEDALRAAVRAAAPEVLVHCVTVTDGDAQRLWRVNVHSALVACAEGAGDIVLSATLAGILPVAAPPAFAATQAALLGMTRALAKEIGPRGARINLVVYGVLEGQASALRAEYQRFSALGRIGTVDEVARAVRWLALDNRYVTGQMISLTGGL